MPYAMPHSYLEWYVGSAVFLNAKEVSNCGAVITKKEFQERNCGSAEKGNVGT